MKQNLLLSIVIIIIVIGYLVVKPTRSTQQTDFSLQSQCAQRAKDFVSANYPTDGYANHYNSKENKCFVELTDNKVNDYVVGGYNYMADVWDANDGPSGKIYAQINIYLPKGTSEFNYTAGKVEECFVGETQCNSYDQFNSLVKKAYGIDGNF